MHITTRWDVVRKYRTTCFLVTTSFVASVISGAIYSRAKSPLAILVASMVGVIFTGSLLRHCVRHVVTWVQATHQDLHRAHLIAGAIDCLVGSCPELIFALVAVGLEKVSVVQTVVAGAILSNNLLVLGLCFIVAGWESDIDCFPRILAVTNARLQLIALGGLVAVSTLVSYGKGQEIEDHLPVLSRVIAFVLLLLYVCYWWYFFGVGLRSLRPDERIDIPAALVQSSVPALAVGSTPVSMTLSHELALRRHKRAKDKVAKLQPVLAVLTGAIAAALTGWQTYVMLDHLDVLLKGGNLPLTFVELVILPIATTTLEKSIAVIHAKRREMEWTVQETLDSSIHMTFFVMPISVCVAWATGLATMTLDFDGFQLILVFLAGFVVSNMFHVPDGRWVEGAMLVAFYVVVIVAAWFYPDHK